MLMKVFSQTDVRRHLMRQYIFILFLFISSARISGQGNFNCHKYYSPYNKPDVLPFADNIFFTQDYYDNFLYYHSLSDSLNNIKSDSSNFFLIVDTSKIVTIEESFSKADTFGKFIEYPKSISWYENGKYKQIERNTNVNATFCAYNVKILNNQNYNQNILLVAGTGLRLIQEFLDSNGNWKSIEEVTSLDCGMDSGWFTIKPGQEVITRIHAYRGDYKTLLRVKLFVGNAKVIYSEPFSGSINSKLLQPPQNIIQIDGINYEFK
jgi:hypothetical protein